MSDEQRDRRDGERAGYVAAQPCEGAAQGARDVSTPAGRRFEGPGGVYVMDTDTHNAIGYYRTEDAALSDVAEIVAEH